MEYTLEYRTNSLPMELFRQKYQDRDKYIIYCQECPNYNTVWSCPPLPMNVDEYLKQYQWVNIAGVKINLSSRIIAEADTPEKLKALGWKILITIKKDMEEKLRRWEQIIPGSISLSSGGCNLCQDCTRKVGKPCRQPDKMRYSLDAFGFNLSSISQEMLGIQIKWCQDRLPDYFTLIHGLLTREALPNELWNTAELNQK